MHALLEAGGIPGGVAVGRAAMHAVHRLVGRLVAVHGEREARLQVDAPLVPVDIGDDVQPPRCC